MNKTAIVFWSGTGNTEAMANIIADSARENGAETDVFNTSEFEASMIKEYDFIAFGCPAMGSEMLEENEFEPLFDSCKSELKGKKIALFGSYGWGDGEWMRNWEEECKKLGAILMCEPVICNDAPDDEAAVACNMLGRSVS